MGFGSIAGNVPSESVRFLVSFNVSECSGEFSRSVLWIVLYDVKLTEKIALTYKDSG